MTWSVRLQVALQNNEPGLGLLGGFRLAQSLVALHSCAELGDLSTNQPDHLVFGDLAPRNIGRGQVLGHRRAWFDCTGVLDGGDRDPQGGHGNTVSGSSTPRPDLA